MDRHHLDKHLQIVSRVSDKSKATGLFYASIITKNEDLRWYAERMLNHEERFAVIHLEQSPNESFKEYIMRLKNSSDKGSDIAREVKKAELEIMIENKVSVDKYQEALNILNDK